MKAGYITKSMSENQVFIVVLSGYTGRRNEKSAVIERVGGAIFIVLRLFVRTESDRNSRVKNEQKREIVQTLAPLSPLLSSSIMA